MATEVQTGRKKLAVIDGKSVFYRGYYAMPNLSTGDGTPTGGVFGFASMALEVIKRLKPDYVAVAWDKPKTNIRRRLDIYPAYKAGRKPAPPDFHAQVPVLRELLDAFGWPLYEFDDYEADDIMGTLALQAAEQDIETLLITSDMDMLQLVNDKVHVFALKKGLSNIELYSPESFEEKYHIRVDQFLDLKSLKGDSSDNIPGVPGIGEKGGVELLQQYETLDGIYDNLGLVRDSIRKKLEAGKDSAYMSHELARIWTDAPMKINLKEMDGSGTKPEAVLDMLQKLEFRSLARQLPDIMQVAIDNHQSEQGSTALPFKPGKNVVVASEAELKNVKLPTNAPVFVYSRSAGKHGRDPQYLCVSADAKTIYSFDLRMLSAEAVLKTVGAWHSLVGYDLKATLKVLLALEVADEDTKPRELIAETVKNTVMRPVEHDLLVGAFMINALRREQTLTELASSDIGYEGSSFEDIDTDELMSRIPDIFAVMKGLYEQQKKGLADIPKLSSLAIDIEWPVIPVLAAMEFAGIEVDKDYLAKFSDEVNDLINDYQQQIYGHADQEFTIGSPAQLAEILFEKLELPTKGIKKGKTGYSTAASELDKLRDKHPIIDLVTQYREVVKLKNTYIDSLQELADEYSRIHTTFNLATTQTGRLSSTDPNLQNIPTRTDLGRRIRTAFVAGQGKKLVSADYSQFELRLAAVLAEDNELIEMFNRGADIHAATAAQVNERKQEDVTKQMRSAAKTINFGVLYGMSPHGLSIATGMDFMQAKTFIDRYKDVRKPLFEYMDKVRDDARKDGYVATLFGRRRPMPDIHSSNFMVRQGAERAAINMPIQGTEADLMKMAMIQVQDKLEKYADSNMLLQIHDSILIECPASVADDIAKMLKETMEGIYKLPVRLDVDVTVGDNWGEL